MQAEELLRQGQLTQALDNLQEQIRKDPANARYRVFLFQLLSVLGQWERAITQLNVAAELDPINIPMAQMCRAALNSEALRKEIFEGSRSPLVFGEPEQWVSWIVQANYLFAQGHHGQSQELRQQALEAAPAVSGTINGQPFEWLADADFRLGPILEANIHGRYYWVPMYRIHQIDIEPPSDLRDLVWTPAQFRWTNGGESVGLIPTRYPGSESSTDTQVLMARKTDWVQAAEGLAVGIGQRLLATDQTDYPLLETRQIIFNNTVEEAVTEQTDG